VGEKEEEVGPSNTGADSLDGIPSIIAETQNIVN